MGQQRRSIETVQNMARISKAQQRTAISITDADTEEIIIASSMFAIEIQNNGNEDVYYGGSDVASSDGIALYSGDKLMFTNVENTFSIYFVVAAGKNSELRMVEYK